MQSFACECGGGGRNMNGIIPNLVPVSSKRSLNSNHGHGKVFDNCDCVHKFSARAHHSYAFVHVETRVHRMY